MKKSRSTNHNTEFKGFLENSFLLISWSGFTVRTGVATDPNKMICAQIIKILLPKISAPMFLQMLFQMGIVN